MTFTHTRVVFAHCTKAKPNGQDTEITKSENRFPLQESRKPRGVKRECGSDKRGLLFSIPSFVFPREGGESAFIVNQQSVRRAECVVSSLYPDHRGHDYHTIHNQVPDCSTATKTRDDGNIGA